LAFVIAYIRLHFTAELCRVGFIPPDSFGGASPALRLSPGSPMGFIFRRGFRGRRIFYLRGTPAKLRRPLRYA
jgi:hypothetical protein